MPCTFKSCTKQLSAKWSLQISKPSDGYSGTYFVASSHFIYCTLSEVWTLCQSFTGTDPEILKRGALCRPPWLVAEENFRFQIVCKGQNNFGEMFLSLFLNFLHFYIQWKFADEILSIFQNLQTLLWGKGNNTHTAVNEKKKKKEREK